MKKLLKYVLVAVLLMILWAGALFLGTLNGWFHRRIAPQNTSKSFLAATEQEIAKRFVGNFAMATFKGGIVDCEKFHSTGKPVDRNTVFQVSSLSKWISAFGIMKLVEEGKLDLDAPVSKYLTRWQLPQGAFNNEAVTMRRLLSHTAGLTDELGYSGFETGTPVQSIEQSLTKAADADEGVNGAVYVGIKPGSAFKYSGGGYTLLQLLVEEVSGQSFASYMSESAATSLYTSLSDLESFFQAHFKGKNNEPIGRNVVKPATLKMMRQPHAQKMGIDIWGSGQPCMRLRAITIS